MLRPHASGEAGEKANIARGGVRRREVGEMGEVKFCPRCGTAAKEGVSFCTSCGMELKSYPEGKPEAVPPEPEAAATVALTGSPTLVSAKKNRTPLILGIAGGLLIAAGVVILVLFLIVWRNGEGGVGDPLSLARKYMQALEQKDADSYMECFDEDYFSMGGNPFFEEMEINPEDMVKMGFQFMVIKFRGVELQLQSEKDDRAVVVTASGTLNVSVMGLENEVDLAHEPLEFRMAKKNGRWRLVEDPLPTLNGREMPEEDRTDTGFEDFNLQNLQDYFPEGMDLENLDLQDLERMMREMEEWMEEEPSTERPPAVSVLYTALLGRAIFSENVTDRLRGRPQLG